MPLLNTNQNRTPLVHSSMKNVLRNTVAKVHTTRLFQSFKEWAKENNEAEQIRSSRAMISLLRERGFDVSVGNQNKHYVHGLGLEAEETETLVN